MALSDAQADQIAALLNARNELTVHYTSCLLYTSPSPRD